MLSNLTQCPGIKQLLLLLEVIVLGTDFSGSMLLNSFKIQRIVISNIFLKSVTLLFAFLPGIAILMTSNIYIYIYHSYKLTEKVILKFM